MPKSIKLYSNIWATVLMALFFFISGFTGQSTPSYPRDPATIPSGSGRATPTNPQQTVSALAGKTIVIDPGHGGSDPGTVGVGKTTEAQNVIAIAWDLKSLLESAGANVVMTRKNDVNPASGTSYQYQINGQLAVRTATANRSGADIYVSIHNDWNDNRSIAGTSTYYYHQHDWLLAESIQQALSQQLGSRNVGVRRGNFFVLRNTSMPSALVEVGFLSNQREAELLSQSWYRLEAARGVFQGIANYFHKSR